MASSPLLSPEEEPQEGTAEVDKSFEPIFNHKINGLNLVVKGQATSPSLQAAVSAQASAGRPLSSDQTGDARSVPIPPTVQRKALSGISCLHSSCMISLTLAFTVSLAFSIFSATEIPG